jgi:hypothetical protein
MNNPYFSKEENEMIDNIRQYKELNKKDIHLVVYHYNELYTISFEDLKKEINNIIREYRHKHLKYDITIYSNEEYINYVGIDTYNNKKDIYEVLENGDYTRNSCIHFKFTYDKIIKIKENDKRSGYINSYIYEYVD